MRTKKISARMTFDPNELYIIAEAGVNHNGDVNRALEMIEVAKSCGADAVKFQTWITDQVYSRHESIKPEYQKQETDPSESEYETVKKLELSFKTFRLLKRHADKVGITLLSTPDERASADFLLRDLHVPAMKVASQDVNNLPFLRYLAGRHIPMILSTGASSFAETAVAVDTILSAGCPSLALLHCTSCYPAPSESVNLRTLTSLREAFRLPVGYSDHTAGNAIACAAVGLGACILEKHFTLSRQLLGPDQQASLEPSELGNYIRSVRSVKVALGDGIKRVALEELSNRTAMRRYLTAARELRVGLHVRARDIVFKKMAYGLEPDYLNLVVGSTVRRRIKKGSRIQFNHLEFSAGSGFSRNRFPN